jgi:hypothetical protein
MVEGERERERERERKEWKRKERVVGRSRGRSIRTPFYYLSVFVSGKLE